jgi:hypothetical protein
MNTLEQVQAEREAARQERNVSSALIIQNLIIRKIIAPVIR